MTLDHHMLSISITLEITQSFSELGLDAMCRQ